MVEGGGFEPPNSEEDRFTVCCRWPLDYLPNCYLIKELPMSRRMDSNLRPADYEIAVRPNSLYFSVPSKPKILHGGVRHSKHHLRLEADNSPQRYLDLLACLRIAAPSS